jgi:signal transduction histidine kinase
MPYILLDNSVKYSPNGSEITITLEDHAATLHIRAESVGPCLEADERSLLGVVGFRGKHARKRVEVGTGQGLALLKTICACHGASMFIESASSGISFTGIPYGLFTVDIQIPEA